ncbi:MAG: L,D-transpeptidase family protein [Syntrophobacteraceae bacterium]
MRSHRFCAMLLAAAFMFATVAVCSADEVFTATIKRYAYHIPDQTVIGDISWCKIAKNDTLLDIARRYGLGYNEVDLLYPRMDAWIPPDGKRIAIPTFWVVPPSQHEQLVINIPELRLYFFEKSAGAIQTYPIGIGDEGWESPLGSFYINDKRQNPVWYVPQSLQAKYGMASMPPGPDNPLGEFVMKFSAGAYGVHGTSMPWGVGRLVSHGCIRCYPEHIRILYPQVPMRYKLEIIYEPIKLGRRNGQIFVEAHPDVYRKIPDFMQYATQKLESYPYAAQIDRKRFFMAIALQNGVPTDVTKMQLNDISLKTVDLIQ